MMEPYVHKTFFDFIWLYSLICFIPPQVLFENGQTSDRFMLRILLTDRTLYGY